MKRWWIVPLALLSGWAAVQACGPYFGDLFLSRDRAAHFKQPIPFTLSESLQALALPSPLAPPLRDLLRAQALKQAKDGSPFNPDQAKDRDRKARALAKPGSSPSLALYEAAAAEFHQEHWPEAQAGFEKVLALPAADAKPRAIWAAYSLGRARSATDVPAAEAAFTLTRELLLKGAEDPLGLAVDSLGAQAALRLNGSTAERVEALRLYFEQARLGSESGLLSLMQLQTEWLDREPELLRAVVASDWGEALVLRLALDGNDSNSSNAQQRYRQAVAVMAHEPALHEPGLWATLAWNAGDLEHAATWARQAEGSTVDAGLAEWVQAKVDALHGRLDTSAAHFSAALRTLRGPDAQLHGDASALALVRGDMVQALEQLYAAGDSYTQDAVDLADSALSRDELKAFVDRHPGAEAPLGATLRQVLARRLMREGRFDQALPYFPTDYVKTSWDWNKRQELKQTVDLRDLARQYADAARSARSGWDAVARARAHMEAGALAREWGLELMGFALGRDDALHDGSYLDEGDNALPVKGAPAEAHRRTLAAATQPLPEGWRKPIPTLHYRFVAAEHALRAAAELPPRSQAYAVAMCQASQWVSPRESEFQAQVYGRYLKTGAYVSWGAGFGRECPEPEWQRARWQGVKQSMHARMPLLWRHPRRSAAIAALALLLLPVGVALFVRRRHRARAQQE